MLPKLLFVLSLFFGLFVGFRVVQNWQFRNDIIAGYQRVSPPSFLTPTPREERDGQLETYISKNLNLSFSFFQYKKSPAPIKVLELNDKIYVYSSNSETEKVPPTQAKFVQVFKKDPNESLVEAVTTRFLKGFSSKDCEVVTGNMELGYTVYEPNFEYVRITIPNTAQNAPYSQLQEKANKCPKEYLAFKEIRYFAMDKNHPDRFVFVSLGQDNFTAYPDTTWDMTLRFLK